MAIFHVDLGCSIVHTGPIIYPYLKLGHCGSGQVEPAHKSVLANKGFTHCAERSSKCRAPQNGKMFSKLKIRTVASSFNCQRYDCPPKTTRNDCNDS